ncbi:MAG: hypothetical protein IJK84_03385 [Bacteroidales bacterium]|nr:hypothetical protein [Bacteroidales bacterium]
MKKIAFILLTSALMVGAVSCKKDKIEPEEVNPVPVYAEGVYHPVMKIATVSENGSLAQEWSWVGDNLDRIEGVDGSTTAYSYMGNYISKVTSTGDQAQEIRYSYDANNTFASCDLYYGGAKAVGLSFEHNASGKLSGADITIDDNFLLSLAGNLLGFGTGFEKLLGRQGAEALIMMVRLSHNGGAKFSVGEKAINAALEWEGDNVSKMIVSGNVTVLVDTNDLNLLSRFVEIPAEYLPIIQLAMSFNGGLPITLTMSDTIACTYDTNYNPRFCNWGEIMSPQVLSLNNVLTMTTTGSISITASLLGQILPLYSYPMDDYTEYQYQYNEKRYPTHVSGDVETDYAYKP